MRTWAASGPVSSSDLGGQQQAAGTETSQNGVDIAFGKGETSFAAAELSVFAEHCRSHVPGAVNDDGALFRIAVAGIETDQSHGAAMLAGVIVAGEIRAFR